MARAAPRHYLREPLLWRWAGSVDGGRFPAWGPVGSNAPYYVAPSGEMMAAEVELTPNLRLGEVKKPFELEAPPPGISGQQFDVSPIDGRLLVPRLATDTDSVTEVSVVPNWLDELRRLAP